MCVLHVVMFEETSTPQNRGQLSLITAFLECKMQSKERRWLFQLW